MYRLCLLALIASVVILTCVYLAEARGERPDPRFVAVIRDAAAHYATWGRVDEKPNIAPELCRTPAGDDFGVRSQVRESKARGGAHGEKLYYLWASAKDAYLTLAHADKPLPVGFAVVKQSFSSRPLTGERPVEEMPGPHASSLYPHDPPPITWLETADGRRLGIDQPKDLFVMAKVGNRAGSDAGWIYGTVAPDGTVTSAGRVKSCMRCHESARHERLFGLRASRE